MISTQELETVSINSSESNSYGTLQSKSTLTRQLTKRDIWILFFVSWNIYSSRKIPFPFSSQLASIYGVSLETFSYLLAAYDFGGFCSIFMAPFPIFNRIQINWTLSILTSAIAAIYFILSFSNNLFVFFFITRMMVGFISTLLQAQIRSILGTFLKDSRDKQIDFGSAVTATESGWWSSTISWVFVGIILHRLTVSYVWYYVACCALICGILCYSLPHCTIAQVLRMNASKQKIGKYEEELKDDDVVQYHTYFCFLTIFCVAMAYNAYMSSFGAWMTQTFDLNPERLGVSTLVITASECTGFLSIALFQRYKVRNVNIAVCSNFCVLLMVICWLTVMRMNVYNEAIIWMIVFVYTVCFEMVYISTIVMNLELAPKGRESQIALFYGVMNRGGVVCGIVVGPRIVKWYGFLSLLMGILGMQCCACLCVCITRWLWTSHNEKKVIK